jgi:hypothetical protein
VAFLAQAQLNISEDLLLSESGGKTLFLVRARDVSDRDKEIDVSVTILPVQECSMLRFHGRDTVPKSAHLGNRNFLVLRAEQEKVLLGPENRRIGDVGIRIGPDQETYEHVLVFGCDSMPRVLRQHGGQACPVFDQVLLLVPLLLHDEIKGNPRGRYEDGEEDEKINSRRQALVPRPLPLHRLPPTRKSFFQDLGKSRHGKQPPSPFLFHGILLLLRHPPERKIHSFFR